LLSSGKGSSYFPFSLPFFSAGKYTFFSDGCAPFFSIHSPPPPQVISLPPIFFPQRKLPFFSREFSFFSSLPPQKLASSSFFFPIFGFFFRNITSLFVFPAVCDSPLSFFLVVGSRKRFFSRSNQFYPIPLPPKR